MGAEYSRLQARLHAHERMSAFLHTRIDKFSVGDHWIDVPKLGRVNMAEKLRFFGKILSARISKTATWWFVSITVEMPDVVPLNTHPPVGVDVGLNRLATLSDGRWYENQRPLAHQLKKLRRLNKELARRTKGGKNWFKTKDKLSRTHSEIACVRLDWLHKLTTEIATTSGIVAVEDLHVKGLIRNRCLSRAFSDAAVGKLLDLLESKITHALTKAILSIRGEYQIWLSTGDSQHGEWSAADEQSERKGRRSTHYPDGFDIISASIIRYPGTARVPL